jgi:NitT/TauT family transport system substrate-binding protein
MTSTHSNGEETTGASLDGGSPAASPISRRTFLKGAAGTAGVIAAGAAGGLLSAGAAEAAVAHKAKYSVTNQLGWLKIAQYDGYLAAIDKGYYAKNGVAATINSGGPNIIASEVIAAGGAFTGDDDNITVLQAIGKGLPLVMYGTIFQKSPNACMSLASDPIRTLKDFAHKTIALTPGDQQQIVPLLKKAGVNPSTVNFVPAQPDPTQLSSHAVQGYFGYATQQGVTLKAEGLKIVIAYMDDLGVPEYGNVLVATKQTIAKHKAELVAFLTATIQGYEYSLTHASKMGQLVVKYGPPGQSASAQTAVARAQAPLIEHPGGIMKITPAKMARVVSSALSSGAITKKLSVSSIMTTEILDAVYRGRTSIPL